MTSRGSARSIAVGTRVDASTVAVLRAELRAAVDAAGSGDAGSRDVGSGDAGDAGDIVLDVSTVQFVDATGLAMLLGVRRYAERAGRRLVLRGTPRRFARLLRATRLDRVLIVERSIGGPTGRPVAAATEDVPAA
jgi:hypothetical protein